MKLVKHNRKCFFSSFSEATALLFFLLSSLASVCYSFFFVCSPSEKQTVSRFCGCDWEIQCVSQTCASNLFIRCMYRVRSIDQSTRWSILMMPLFICTLVCLVVFFFHSIFGPCIRRTYLNATNRFRDVSQWLGAILTFCGEQFGMRMWMYDSISQWVHRHK